MEGNVLAEQIFTTGPMMLFKWLVVLGLGMYSFFAVVVVRQVKMMTESIESSANEIIKTFAWGHVILAIFLAVLAAVVL